MTPETLKQANEIAQYLHELNVDEKRVKDCGTCDGEYDPIEHMSGCYGARGEFERFRAFLLAKIAERRKELQDQLSKL